MIAVHCSAIVLIVTVCQFHAVNCQQGAEGDSPDIGMCQSEYLVQPPDQLTCNPYLNMELKLECIVRLLDTGTPLGRLTVDWFHSTDNLQSSTGIPLAINRLDSVQQNVTIREQTLVGRSSVRVRSRLELLQLDAERNVGQYWCGIRIDSMEWMIPSDPVPLLHPQVYADFLPCSTTVAQSKQERKCAAWSFGPSSSPTTATGFPTAVALPTILPSAGATVQEDQDSTVAVTVTGSSGEPEGNGPLMAFYIAIGIVVAFGSLITALTSLVACMCIKYRRAMRSKRGLDIEEEKAPTVSVQSPSTIATDYLVPLSMVQQRQVLQVPGDNPVYLSGVRKELTTLWLHQQKQRAEGFEHSYETTTHDYEDIFLESLNGGHPVLMKANEAYIIPRTLSSSIDNRLPLQ